MGTSINTAIYPSIPLSRRVINDIEEHQRRVLNSYVEDSKRGMNTLPVQTSNEQEEEVTTTKTGQKAGITQAEMQEITLQLESLETNTGMKQVDPTQGQDSESVQAQNMEENEVPDAKDTSNMQVQDDDTDSQANGKQPDPDIPDDQTSRASQEDNYQTVIDDDEQHNTIQFGNPVTQLFLS